MLHELTSGTPFTGWPVMQHGGLMSRVARTLSAAVSTATMHAACTGDEQFMYQREQLGGSAVHGTCARQGSGY